MSTDTLLLVRNRRAELAKQREALETEDAELAVTERTLVRLAGIRPSGPNGAAKPHGPKLPQPTSQKGLIVATLKTAVRAWFETGEALRKAVQDVHGVDIGKSSFQPYLSELKKTGVIVRDGQRVALAERAH